MTVILSMWTVFLFRFFNCFFSPEAEFNSILREIVLVMRNCCIVMSEIELVFWRAEFRCSGSMYLMLLFKKLYLIQIFNQYLLNKKDDTLRPMDTNLSTWIELSLWRSKRCHEHSMVKFVSTRGYPIPHICVCITEQVYIGQFLSLHFKPGPGRRLRQQQIKGCITRNIFMHHGITKWICEFRCDFCFVLFSFRTTLWPLF